MKSYYVAYRDPDDGSVILDFIVQAENDSSVMGHIPQEFHILALAPEITDITYLKFFQIPS